MDSTRQAVAVLGCGPAGLLAVHAAVLNNRPVAVIATGEKSKLGGAQYLHQPIPVLHDPDSPDAIITHKYEGTKEGYHHKVYPDGQVPLEAVSFGQWGNLPAWNLHATYDQLWDAYGSFINKAVVEPQDIPELLDSGDFSHVFSTIPMNKLCMQGHTFVSQKVWIAGGRLFAPNPVSPKEDNTVIYNGVDDVGWYRCSMTFGIDSCEWPEHRKPPLGEGVLVPVTKPLWNNCTCHPDVVRLGRYGTWTKGVLTHDAFWKVMEVLDDSPVQ